MRVGRVFSRLLDPASDLFADQEGGLTWAEEELWEGAVAVGEAGDHGEAVAAAGSPSSHGQGSAKATESHVSVAAVAAAEAGGPDSDDESDDGLPSFDVRPEDPGAEAWRKADPKYEFVCGCGVL